MKIMLKTESTPERNAQKHRYTVAEFERMIALPDNRNSEFELIDGEIIEKMPTLEHGFIAATVAAALNAHARPNRLGYAAVEGRHRLANDEHNSFLPDVSFMAGRRPLVKQGSADFMPDLAIEIKSPDDTIKQMRDKAEYYLANGTSLVWLVYPQHRMVEVYTNDVDVHILFGSDTLTGGDLLPDFKLPVAEVFVDPFVE